MTTCLFHAGADCPSARELADLDRQIDLRLKAESENKRLKEALKDIMTLAGNPDAIAACRLIIREAREALNDRG